MLDLELDTLPRLFAASAEPSPDIDDRTFGEFFDGDARVVCLGEASHGSRPNRWNRDSNASSA
jgi:erythromycin esterase-like protein